MRSVGILLLLACVSVSCRLHDKAPELSDAVKEVVSGKPLVRNAAIWKEVAAVYEQRAFKPLWVEHKYVAKKAADAVQVIRDAQDHGLSPEDYGEKALLALHASLESSDKDAPDRLRRLADFEARTTAALLALGHDVALGRTRPQGQWKAERQAPDFVATFVKAADSDVTTWLDEVRPRHPEYVALQKAFVDLRGQQEKGGWPKVPAGTFKIGKSHPAVAVLRQRLTASGVLKGAPGGNPNLFDDSVVTAVKAFQDLHAIKATGVVDKPTLAALNVPIETRLRQVAINLERWRWMPDDLGERHFFVNIPYFHLIAREHGKAVMDIRVVVGKPGNETPIFSDVMETVVFSPYWNIPDSIKQGETAPAVARDPSYLERNNIEVFRGSRRVDVASIDWSDPGSLRELSFRQRPGDQNALGHVKFLFPNDYDVYLHDTPADSLFARTGRAFSHGCVRVEEPEVLAKYVLRDAPEWDGPRILKAMHSGREQQVKLEHTIPVHIAYFTAWVDENGGLHFQPDIYGYDDRQTSTPRATAVAE